MLKIFAYMEIWTTHQGSLFLCSASLPSFSRLILNKEFSFRQWGLYSRREICEGCKDKKKFDVLTQVDRLRLLLLMSTNVRGWLLLKRFWGKKWPVGQRRVLNDSCHRTLRKRRARSFFSEFVRASQRFLNVYFALSSHFQAHHLF